VVFPVGRIPFGIFYAWNQLRGDAGLSITDPLFGRGG
jgi:hypothetical protein